MAFRFKQFSVEDDESSMRVGTDAILLGAFAEPPPTGKILEIGTGCGVIALMMAQRSDATITALDIHEPSIRQSADNFRSSPWSERLTPLLSSFQDMVSASVEKFDLILSNPPFFSRSLKSPNESKNISKHDDLLTKEEVMAGARKLLKSTSSNLTLIMSASTMEDWINAGLKHDLHLNKQLWIQPVKGKPANRVILQFSIEAPSSVSRSELYIREHNYTFSKEYMGLTQSFYLNF